MKARRDLSIDRLLRRSLPRHEPKSPCPDAEALAAFADDGLAEGERQSVEVHIADCHRCQALTAAVMQTGSPGLQALLDSGSASPWWRRPFGFNWLIPATAAAAAVVLWVVVPGQRHSVTEERQAEAQVAPRPTPEPASPPVVETLRSPVGERTDNQARVNETSRPFDSAASADARLAAPAEAVVGRVQPQDRLAREERAAAAPTALRAAGLRAVDFEVVSSDPTFRWRVGPAGVQRSTDAGSTWTSQEVGPSATWTAGSAPSPSVCWIVGSAGAVWRSVDGRQWQPVAFPETGDLVAVRALDAETATVELSDGRRLHTTTGGQTWAPVQP